MLEDLACPLENRVRLDDERVQHPRLRRLERGGEVGLSVDDLLDGPGRIGDTDRDARDIEPDAGDRCRPVMDEPPRKIGAPGRPCYGELLTRRDEVQEFEQHVDHVVRPLDPFRHGGRPVPRQVGVEPPPTRSRLEERLEPVHGHEGVRAPAIKDEQGPARAGLLVVHGHVPNLAVHSWPLVHVAVAPGVSAAGRISRRFSRRRR